MQSHTVSEQVLANQAIRRHETVYNPSVKANTRTTGRLRGIQNDIVLKDYKSHVETSDAVQQIQNEKLVRARDASPAESVAIRSVASIKGYKPRRLTAEVRARGLLQSSENYSSILLAKHDALVPPKLLS